MNLPVKPQIHKISHVDWISFAVIVAFLVVVAIAIYLEIYPSSIVNGSGGFILHEEDKVFLLHIGSMVLLLSIFIIRTVTNHVKRSSDEKFSALEKYHVVLHQKIIEMTRGQLEGNGARWVFDKMLDDLLELTSSEYGFVGRVFEKNGAKYLHTYSITDIAWNEETRKLYKPEGMIFDNLDTLWGAVLKTSGVVISNDPLNDSRSGGLPKGHPPMNSFLGIPVVNRNEIIAVLGVANRDGGYSADIVEPLAPFLNACGRVIWGEELKRDIVVAKEKYQTLFDSSPHLAAMVLFADDGPIVSECNENYLKELGYDKHELMGWPLSDVMTPESYQAALGQLGDSLQEWTGTYEFPVDIVRKDGTIVNTISSYVPIYRDGKVIGSSGILRKIDEAERHRQEVIKTQSRKNQLLDGAGIPIFSASFKNNVFCLEEWNKEALVFFGLDKESAQKPKEFFGLFTDRKSVRSIKKSFLDAVRLGVGSGIQVKMHGLNGQDPRYALFTFAPVMASENSVEFVVITARDVSSIMYDRENLMIRDQALGQLSVGAFIANPNKGCKIVYQNKAMERIFGTPSESEDMSSYLGRWLSMEDRQHFRAAVKGKTEISRIISHLDENGMRKTAELRLRPLIEKDHDVSFWVGLYADMTTLSQQRDEAETMAGRLSNILESMNDALIICDNRGDILEINPAVQDIFGYHPDEMIGQSVTMIMHPEAARIHCERFKYPEKLPAKPGTVVPTTKVTAVRKDGKVIPIEITISKLAPAESNTFTAVIHDLTDYEEALDKAKASAAELALVANDRANIILTANAPIMGVDDKGRINEWNNTAAEITGYTRSELIGLPLVDTLIPVDYRKDVNQILAESLAGIETSNYEMPLLHKDGKKVQILFNTTSRKNVNGDIEGVIGVGQDITELKNKELALAQAVKMEGLGKLTGGIAHDFNNLLTVISGSLEYLKEITPGISGDMAEALGDAQSALVDGVSLTQSLLAFARNQKLEPVSVDLNKLIKNHVRLLRRTIGEDVAIEARMMDRDVFARVDKGQLESVVLNLCLNAADAMDQSGQIIISTGIVDRNTIDVVENVDLRHELYVSIVVEDSGPGIPEELRGLIFEPFYTNKQHGKGSGMGLSMAHGFISQSGGLLLVGDSQLGGARFDVYLPMAVADKTRKVADASRLKHDASGMRLLLVEDNDSVRKVAARVLKTMGFHVVQAGNADEALRVLEREQKFDILFSDIQMPGDLSGRDLAEIVSRNYPDIKIQLATGYEVIAEQAEVKSTNFTVLKKPYTKEKLRDALENL